MKALAIRQPFAWLIVRGHKEVEYRPWLTHYRGPFLVHANKAVDREEVEQLRMEKAKEGIIIPYDLPRGGIVGVVTLVDCVQYDDVGMSQRFLDRLRGNQRSSSYGFALADPRPLPFVPYRGQQKFFNVPDDLYGSEMGV